MLHITSVTIVAVSLVLVLVCVLTEIFSDKTD